jgi:WD40 repeat protein
VEVVGPGVVRVFETSTGARVAAWDSGEFSLGSVALSPDNRLLVAGGSGVVVFDLLRGELRAEWPAHLQPTDAVEFSPDGALLATGSQEGMAKLWEVGSWNLVAVLQGHLLGVHAVGFSPNGRRLATGSVGEEAVKLWDLGTGQEVLNLAWPGQLVSRLAFSADGETLMAESSRGEVRFWRADEVEPEVEPRDEGR